MHSPEIIELARSYAERVQTATTLSIAAEPEAQLTVPVSNFLSDFAKEVGLGELQLIREAQLDGVRPDFVAVIDQRQCGWVELKAPGHTLIGANWRGREKQQWELLSELDALIVSNGEQAALYINGAMLEICDLPLSSPELWDPEPLHDLLQKFFSAKPTPIRRVSQLADRLAPLARFIRLRLDEGIEHNLSAVRQAQEAWDATVHETTSSTQFSSDVAQVIAYSMAIAGLSGEADINKDGTVTLEEAKDTLARGQGNVLAAALGPILGIPELTEYIAAELDAIVRLIASMDVDAIHNSKDSRGEPWLWFYEDFLAKYDPEARKQSGVYYTPMSVVQFQVRIVDDLLRNKFNQRLGFGSRSVITLDPAAGSGTYPIAVIDKAAETAFAERGPAGSKQVADNLTKNILAFELLPGPYAVAHLRIGQRLAEAKGQLQVQFEDINVYLTDTLESPNTPPKSGLFGDARVLAEASEKARKIKAENPITVAIGNPPYDRVTSDTGGWVTSGDQKTDPLFNDVIKPAQETGVIFSAQASLYNLYVYFWRWAIWKVFENDPQDKAIISFITASSWLDGPAFVGLRKLAIDTASEIWVLDLGGEGRGARKEENVFDIQSPVAIVTLVRTGKAAKPASVYYRRIRGTRQEKFDQLDSIQRLEVSDGWATLKADNGENFIPASTNNLWSSMPLLADLFPWQQPGIKYNRMWPVAPSASVLKQRWKELLTDSNSDVRAEKYVTAKTGRNIHTQVGDLPRLADLPEDAPHQPIVRMGWRSFDRQWTFDDPRLAKTDSPALWQSLSPQQIFLVSPWSARISNGPAATVSTGVPDLHYYCNRGGKDIIPLYRDAHCAEPNITRGILKKLSEAYDYSVSPEDLMAYCYALIAHEGYSKLFWEELENSPVRLPITTNPQLFQNAVTLGRELLWLQTFGERAFDEDHPVGSIPSISGMGWIEPVTTLPETTKDIRYDNDTHELHIGDGIVSGVLPEVWSFEVSGMNILDKWLGSRTRKGIGRAASKSATPLDRIRPEEWEDEWNDELLDLLRVLTKTLELAPAQQELLEQILNDELMDADALPKPSNAERKVPKTLKRDYAQTFLDV